MSCEVDQIGDCGDTATLARALFIGDKEDSNWLSQCSVSLSPCSNLLAVGYKTRLCLLTSQWISATDSSTYLISWSGTLSSEITVVLVLPICPSQQSSQNGPDWFCVIVGFKNGNIAFYTDTGHLLLSEKLDEKPVMKVSCHTGTYGTLPDDIHVLFQTCQCIISGSSLFQTLRNAKSQLAKVQAGLQDAFTVDSRSVNIRKWLFADQEIIQDSAIVGLELKNSYDHLLAASTYGGYDTWYRSVPPVNSLILGAGAKPYIGFHYALEGGTTPPLQDVARAVANKIKSALPGWLGGGNSEATSTNSEPLIRSETLSLRSGLIDVQRQGTSVVVSPDRQLAAFTDNFGRVSVLDVKKGYLIRMFKGYRDAQCAFVQIFDLDKKVPHMAVVKEIKRAIFLIIYNPRKGLIDIRLMQRGNRVAVFTATKNGKLIYNTCGLVGAEKNYTYKKINLPEFQCVLIDPDGKLKRINIPFFYALEGEHSERSKDLHILRDLRDYIKKTLKNDTSDFEEHIIKRAAEIKTLDLKKHCLEILIKNYEIPVKVIMACLSIFWNSIQDDNENTQMQEMKSYFVNLGLLTLFYLNINNENTNDMQELCTKLHDSKDIQNSLTHNSETEDEINDFHLLEDDSCILERLLLLVQESEYKDQQHARVTFADSRATCFKEFVSCFSLDGSSQYISLKTDISDEKLRKLASDTFESIFKIVDKTMISHFIKISNVDPKDIVKLIIMHLMEMPLEQMTVEVIEKIVEILFYVCRVNEDATNILYNEVSPWWQNIRDILIDMTCPLRSLIVAMACKAVGRIFESKYNERDEDAWESVTTENAKWGLLIGKLEDISILSIILMFKDEFKGSKVPKLQYNDIKINLKFIYTRGKGSVTELIAKWLCSMAVLPEAIVVNELLETKASRHFDSPDKEEDNDDDTNFVFLENHRYLVDDNPKIFKWLSLLRRQFPLSTMATYLVANMCWEYAIAWQRNMHKTDELQSVLSCLTNISDLHLRLGLFSIIWSTYIKQTFEAICRLINKVGRLPKDSLCLQDVGLNNVNMTKFLDIVTDLLDNFFKCSSMPMSENKKEVKYENIWEDSMPSLVEVAQDAKSVNCDILNLNYQVACTVYYMCHFNIKCSKPLDTLYDIDYQYILEALAGNPVHREISLKASEKIRNPRMKFITKLVRAAIETISQIDSESPFKSYNNEECNIWIEKIIVLAELWHIDTDFVKRQQIIALYHLGYDTLTENELNFVKVPESVLPSILAISIQRLKRSLEQSSNQPEWIVSVSPNLYKRLQTTVLDTSIPAHPSLVTTKTVLQKLLLQIDKKTLDIPSNSQNIKMAELIIENCEVLEKL
ncbi:unnamed protein product [Diatraea saccharalis]|uniref:Rab3 GTPase-activating protein non-catalytic subunit n=1 Tax=Diatraea saccharalis TaxID=40085 RepID=A0A9N9QXN0_9NEOP|nr:unnamed protein product [Diatraea saccharalis]